MEAAVVWCLSSGKGARAAIVEGVIHHSKQRTLNRRLAAEKEAAAAAPVNAVPERHDDHGMVLLAEEEHKVVIWVCIRRQQNRGVTNSEISDEVISLLRMRDAANAAADGVGRKRCPLSTAAEAALAAGHISHNWINSFRQRHNDSLM